MDLLLDLHVAGGAVGRAAPAQAMLGGDVGDPTFGQYIGTRVDAGPRYGLGTIRFIGETALGPGVWAGAEPPNLLSNTPATFDFFRVDHPSALRVGTRC
eukprot:SAG31_NODE_28098_length_415_cov_1.145570_1_plen_99_part_00